MLQINLTGYLGQNAKIEEVNNNQKVITFSVASSEKNKDKQGNMIDKTTWVNCYYYINSPKLQEALKKGSHVFVSGKANHAIVLNGAGQNVIRIYLNVDLLDILSVPKVEPGTATNNNNEFVPAPPIDANQPENNGVIDDLPF